MRRRPGRGLLRARRRPAAPATHHRLRIVAQAGVVVAVLAVALLAGFFPRTVRSAPQQPQLRVSLISLPGLAGSEAEAALTSLEPVPVPLTVVAPPVTAEELLVAADATESTLAALQAARSAATQEVDVDEEQGREEEQLPLFYRYVVLEGDTVGSIAVRFGISSDYILWNNIDIISDEDLLTIGELLQVPSVAGIIHSVRIDQTLTEIAALYEADASEITAFAANGLANPDLLREGTTILVPGGRVVPPPAPAIRPAAETPAFVQRDEVSDLGFVWPVLDIITSYFGPFHPLGVDINAPIGTPIAAAAAGQVVFVGGDACCSYGFHVEIKHDETYTTLYAHLGSFAVELGEFVEAGQIIGTGGLTGRSTGPHLHFEVRRNDIYQNPLLYLP